MKRRIKLTKIIPLCFCIGLALSARATITGQWDFKTVTGYDATIGGQAIFPWDTATANGTHFGSTTTFGVSPIGGQATNVMQFPKALDQTSGYYVPVGAYSADQYTVIMDVLFTNYPAAGKTATLFGADNGGTFFVNSGGAVGYSGGVGGSLSLNAWHRIAIAVELTNSASGLAIFIDGTSVLAAGAPSGAGGTFSVGSYVNLFIDPNTNSERGYIGSLQFNDVRLPDGFIAGLGGAVASGVPTSGQLPTPWIVSLAPQNDLRFPARSTISPTPLVKIVLNDGTATVSNNTIVLNLNNAVVTPTVTYSAPTTTISYQAPTALPAGSRNLVTLTYQDSAGHPQSIQYQFDVGIFTALPSSAAGPIGSASTPGFIYRVAQAPADAVLSPSLTRALQQLDGTLLNPTNNLPFANEADLTQAGSQPNGSYFVDLYDGPPGTVAFSAATPPAFGKLPEFTAYAFPGIPGVNASMANFSSDVLAYLPLSAGTYTFGVAVAAARVDTPPDDGYQLFCGANPRDRFSTLVGQYQRTSPAFSDEANTNTFTFVAPVAGVYPFRLVYWHTARQADLAWYYVDPTSGANVLINGTGSSIPAYRVSSIQREPYVAEVYPVPGGKGFAASEPIKIILSDDDLQVGTAPNGPKLFLNGAQVTPNSVTKAGKLTTIIYNPNALRTTVTNNVTLVYSDNAGTPKSFTNNWAFTIVVGGGGVAQVAGQWDFNNGNLAATVGKDLKYFDGPSGQTASLTQFGTCSSFGLPTINGVDGKIMMVPAVSGAVEDNFGYIMDHQIAANGGGTKVNQYTIIWDMYWPGGGGVIPFFNCQNTNNVPDDGSLFLQGGSMGQGGGGYTMNHGPVTAGWHRIAFSVDLSQNLITKWVDGIKAQDWVSSANGLDAARRAWQPTVLLFADGQRDDHNATVYVKSIQVRNGRLSDAEMVALGGPSAAGIPTEIPVSTVTGQWDFQFGDLSATVGKDLQYFDGAGSTSNLTQFGTCSSFSIPLIGTNDAKVMMVPAVSGAVEDNFGYIMDHQITANGGGTKVNQYTIIWDMYWPGGGGVIPFFNCQNTNNVPDDGSLFLQGGGMGQGGSGYTMNHGPVTAGWHRLAFAVDLSQNLITKWVDGIKAQDWVSSANGLDAARRAWQPTVLLFADGQRDDHNATVYVRSIQVSVGKMSDAQMVALGSPDGKSIPVAAPASSVTGQWDFQFSDLSATVGKDLQYFDGAGSTSNLTQFGVCSAFSIPPINGVDAKVMMVPAVSGAVEDNFGYIMDHQIAANGGGTKVNQYTIIWDMYWPGGGGVIPFFNCQNTNNVPDDGSLFLQGGSMGQGGGGYVMDNGPVTAGWHRLAFAVDLSQTLITKWVDGVKAQDWVSSANGLDAARRAWQPTVLLFADGQRDDHNATVYVRSIQVGVGKRSDAYMKALGGASATGIPVYAPVVEPLAPPTFNPLVFSNGQLTISWTGTGTLLESTNVAVPMIQWTPVPGNPSGSYTVTPATNGVPHLYYRLQQ